VTPPDQPPLALTLGDPAGVGPEIVVKAWNQLRREGPAFMVVGDAQSVASASGASMRTVRRVTTPKEAVAVFGEALPVLDIPLRSPVIAGQPSPTAVSIQRMMAGAAYDGARGPIMMLAVPGLRTTLVTVHEPISKVGALLSVEAIVNAGLVTAQAMRRDFGVAEPRLAVAGLNPHAGEDGTIGREDVEIIAPAVAALRAQGVAASGPTPADSLFHEAARARFDAAVCMYHDQALIPVKMLDFWGGVNVTLGLPIVRTSPDHGTAFDIAGRGLARPDSLIAAIRMAAEIAGHRAA